MLREVGCRYSHGVDMSVDTARVGACATFLMNLLPALLAAQPYGIVASRNVLVPMRDGVRLTTVSGDPRADAVRLR